MSSQTLPNKELPIKKFEEVDKKIEALDMRLYSVEDSINSISTSCFQHKLQISTKMESIDKAFAPGGVIESMSKKLDHIDHRLFRTNGARSLVDEVRDIEETAERNKEDVERILKLNESKLQDHIESHKDGMLLKKQYLYLILSILLASSVGTAITTIVSRTLSSDQAKMTRLIEYTERNPNNAQQQ